MEVAWQSNGPNLKGTDVTVTATVIVTVDVTGTGTVVVVTVDAVVNATNVASVVISLEIAATDEVRAEIVQIEIEAVTVVAEEVVIDVILVVIRATHAIHAINATPAHTPAAHLEATQSTLDIQNATVVRQQAVTPDLQSPEDPGPDPQNAEPPDPQEAETPDRQRTAALINRNRQRTMVMPADPTRQMAEPVVHQATARTVLTAILMDIQMVA